MSIRIVFFALFILTPSIQPARSQEPPCTTRKLPVSFRDAQNLPLLNLSVSDLEAKVHGKPVKIVSLAPDLRPHRIVLALDNSGSMGSIADEPPLWKLELSLARHFFAVNQQRSQIALLFFNKRVNDVVDFSQGNSAVSDRLRQLDKDPTNVKGLTDAQDNASTHSGTDVNQRLAVTSARLFAVLLEDQRTLRVPRELFLGPDGPDELSEIARKSGGEILSAATWHAGSIALSANSEARVKTQETLARLYQTILQDSLLEIELPFPIAKNERWELRLADAARRQWKNAQITYPDTLLGCDAEVFGSGRN